MNTLKEIKVPAISDNILSEFDEFKDWHFELKASLNKGYERKISSRARVRACVHV